MWSTTEAVFHVTCVGQAINPLSANPEKWSNTLKQIVSNLPTICLSVFDHFMNLAFKGLIALKKIFLDIYLSKYVLVLERQLFLFHLKYTFHFVKD